MTQGRSWIGHEYELRTSMVGTGHRGLEDPDDVYLSCEVEGTINGGEEVYNQHRG